MFENQKVFEVTEVNCLDLVLYKGLIFLLLPVAEETLANSAFTIPLRDSLPSSLPIERLFLFHLCSYAKFCIVDYPGKSLDWFIL